MQNYRVELSLNSVILQILDSYDKEALVYWDHVRGLTVDFSLLLDARV